MQKVIEVSGLSKSYGRIKALDNLDFEVFEGDVFGFLGPNGAGKSTAIRCLLSLIRPDQGNIKIFGKDLSSNRNQILRKIGSIIEKPDFYKYLPAKKNLEIMGRLSGSEITEKRIFEILEYVGLKGREKDKVGTYSHGMKQRLGIAQTLLHDPELIILDEPTTGLDPQGIIDIRNLIMRLKNEQHKTVVLSSHLLPEIELIANRMIIIDRGKSLVQGNVTELLNQQDLIVTFEVSDPNEAKKVITQKSPGTITTIIGDHSLNMNASQEEVASINKFLVEAGISVHSIGTRRKLEDYFLKATQN
jgi:ABC-type multidrug transport system ATPase subunit